MPDLVIQEASPLWQRLLPLLEAVESYPLGVIDPQHPCAYTTASSRKRNWSATRFTSTREALGELEDGAFRSTAPRVVYVFLRHRLRRQIEVVKLDIPVVLEIDPTAEIGFRVLPAMVGRHRDLRLAEKLGMTVATEAELEELADGLARSHPIEPSEDEE